MKAIGHSVKALRRVARRLIGDPRGATAVEYGLILALIVLTMIAAVTALADVTTGMWNNTSAKVAAAH